MAMMTFAPDVAVPWIPMAERMGKDNPIIVHIFHANYRAVLSLNHDISQIQKDEILTEDQKQKEICDKEFNFFKKHIPNVENYTVKTKDGIKKISDGVDYYNYSDEPLIVETLTAITNLSILTLGQKKN